MKRRRRLRTVLLAAAAGVLAMVAGYLTLPAASANVTGPHFVTSANRADPHVIRCEHPDTGHNGYCLYASKDLGQSFAYPDGCEVTGGCLNYYPMRNTYLHYSPNGYSDWERIGGAVAHESDLSWVPEGAYHQWAPAAIEHNGFYYLYVPNVSDNGYPGINETSRIAVWRADNAFGPYELHSSYVREGRFGGIPGYMSDPEPFVDGSNRYLFWATGVPANCGRFKSGKLQSNMVFLESGTIQDVEINGLDVIEGESGCEGQDRPYVEGPSIFKFGEASMPGPYTLVFPAKPKNVPTECTSSVTPSGTANKPNSVIAYATSDSVQGPYTYQGIIMCGSTTEWTNQATIMKVTTPSGKKPWVIVYHDSPGDKERKLHAECLFAGGGKIAGVYRQPLDAANGFDDCIDGDNFSYSGFHVVDPQFPNLPTILSAPNGGNLDLRMNRYAVGPWERFKIVEEEFGNQSGPYTVIGLKSLANGKYMCSTSPSTPLKASCSSITMSNGAGFITMPVSGGGFRLLSDFTGDYISVAGNAYLYPGGTEQAHAAVFTEMHLR